MGVSADQIAKAIARAKAAERQRTDGFIYFVRCQDFIKVGTSMTPRQRVRSMATENPFDFELIGLAIGGKRREAEIHTMLRDYCHRGEWFMAHPEVVAIVESVRAEGWETLAIQDIQKGVPMWVREARAAGGIL